MKTAVTGSKVLRGRGPDAGMCCLMILVGPWGTAPARADKMSSEEPPIHHAPDIPSQLERGFNPTEPP